MTDDPYIGNAFNARKMKEYDNLPKERRDQLKYAPLPIPGWESWRHAKSIARADYGEDHPQAQGKFLWPLRK
jgi:hypothetical protein